MANQLTPPSDLLSPPDDLISPPADLQPSASPSPPPLSKMPGIGGALAHGVQEGITDVGETVGATAGEDHNLPEAQPYGFQDIVHPISSGLPKTAYRLGKSAPVVAGGVAGALGGAAVTANPIGAIAGGAAGAGAAGFLQAYGPTFRRELAKTPKDPDAAFDRTWKLAGIDASASAVSWAAFGGLNPFKGQIKNLALQAFGVQPGISVAATVPRNVVQGRPAAEGVGTAYVEGAAGTLVPVVGHRLVKGVAEIVPRPKGGPKPPPDIQGAGGPDIGPAGPGGPQAGPNGPIPRSEPFAQAAPKAAPEAPATGWRAKRPGETDRAWKARVAREDVVDVTPEGMVVEPAPTPSGAPQGPQGSRVVARLAPPGVTKESMSSALLKAQEEGRLPESARNMFQTLMDQGRMTPSQIKDVLDGKPAAPEPSFRTNPGKIAAEHEAEVSTLETEGTLAARPSSMVGTAVRETPAEVRGPEGLGLPQKPWNELTEGDVKSIKNIVTRANNVRQQSVGKMPGKGAETDEHRKAYDSYLALMDQVVQKYGPIAKGDILNLSPKDLLETIKDRNDPDRVEADQHISNFNWFKESTPNRVEPSLFSTIRELGGIADEGGTVRQLFGNDPKYRNVFRPKAGKSPDMIRSMLQERGWFGHEDRFGASAQETGKYYGDDVQDLYDLIDREARGEPIYHPDYVNERGQWAAFENEMDRAGISANDPHEVAVRKLAEFRKAHRPPDDLVGGEEPLPGWDDDNPFALQSSVFDKFRGKQPRKADVSPIVPSERVGLGADLKRMIDIFGPKMYGANMPQVTAKELLQNSFDAVKMAEQRGDIAPGYGTINIDIDPHKRTIGFSDNGAGMSPETVKKAFLTVAGTDKGDLAAADRSGGFGIAKLAFIFGNDGLKLKTIHDGVMTTMETNSKELLDGKTELKSEATDLPNGTYVEVTVPKTIKGADGEDQHVAFPYGPKDLNIFNKPLIGNVHVTASKPGVGMFSRSESEVLPLGKNAQGLPPKVSTAHFPWGSVDIYLGPATKKHDWQTEPSPEHEVLSAGLHQFTHRILKPDWYPVPYDIVLNVKPKVAAEDTYYPFNNQREGFSKKIVEDIKQLEAAILKQYRAEQAQGTGNKFVNTSVMPITRTTDPMRFTGKFKPNDLSGKMPQGAAHFKLPTQFSIKGGKTLIGDAFMDLAKEVKETDNLSIDKFSLDPKDVQSAQPVFHSNLNKDLAEEVSRIYGIPREHSDHFFAAVGTIVHDFKNMLAKVPGYEEWSTEGHPVGVSLDKNYHGVHIKVPYKGFFINPLTARVKTPNAIAYNMIDTMIHEAAHTGAGGHDENFVSVMGSLQSALEEVTPGLHRQLEDRIVKLLVANKNVYDALKEVFDEADTANIGKNEGIVKDSGQPSGLPGLPRGVRESTRRGLQGPNSEIFSGSESGVRGGPGRGDLEGPPDGLTPEYSAIVPPGNGGNGRPPPGGKGAPPSPAERPDKGYWDEGGPTISQWLTQHEDELYRLMNNNKMDRVDALQALWKIPSGHILRNAQVQAKMFHSGEEEGKFANEPREHTLTPEEAAEWQRVIQPLREMANEEWRTIGPRLSPEQRRMLRGNDDLTGYMHRIVKGKGSEYDSIEGPNEKSDPITGRGGTGRGLGKKSASMHARSPKWVAVGSDGSKKFIDGETFIDARGPKKPQTAQANAAYMDKDAPNGVRFLRPATVEEIESNTNLRYHKNALINTLDNLLKLRRVSRNLDYLNILKADPVFTENSVLKTESPHPPEGWRSTEIPQLNQYWMNPRMANMFDDYYNIGRNKGELGNMLSNLNSALVRMIFANPVTAFMGHGANVAMHTVMQRGAMNFDPKSWPNSIKNFGKAANEVINMGPIYKALMREGMAGQYASQYARDFHPTAVKIMQGEIEKDPKTWTEVAKIAGTTPKIIYDWLSDVSSKGLWMGSDILLMSHIMDLMEQKNMGVHAAIRDAERGIPNYRIPTEAWEGPTGRMFSEFMGNPLLTIFGRYRYGMLKAYAHTVKNALAKEGENLEPPPPLRVEHQPRLDLPWGEGEAPSPPPRLPKGEGEPHTSETKWSRKAKAAGELIALFGLMAVVYPMLDDAVQKLTKNKHASIRRAGATTLPEATKAYLNESYKHPKTANDFKDLHSIQSALFSFPPLMAAAVSLYQNAKALTGKHIYNPKADMEEVLQELAGFAATSPFLGQEAAEWATGHKTWPQVVGGFLGISSPTAAQFAMQRHYANKDTQADTKAFKNQKAKRRRSFEKKIKGLDNWIGKTINPSGGGG